MLRRFLPKGRFARRLAMLSTGTMAGQALLVASSPLLTRLYTPEDFGVLAVFSALAAVLGGIMALRYDFAIPVCRDDAEAAAVTAVGLCATTILVLLVTLGVAAFGADLAARLALGGHGALLWLLPPLLLFWGIGLSLAHWSIRRGTFRANALGNLVQYAGQAALQVALAPTGLGGAGLVLGFSIGQVARSLLLGLSVPAADRLLLARVRWPALRAAAAAHWRYPAFSGTSTLLQSASQMLPAVAIALLYGPAMAGLFGLGQRIMNLPVRMLGEAASSVFLGEVAGADGRALYRLFIKAAVGFAAMGLVMMTPILVAGPQLFAFAFGESWREAGRLTQLLVPLYLVRFITVPVSQTLNVRGLQHVHLTASALNVMAFLGSFAVGAALSLPASETILVYSVASTAAFVFYFVAAWRAARQAALIAQPPAARNS